jgi:hypothetical protein
MVVAMKKIKWLGGKRIKKIRAALFMLGDSVRAVLPQVWSPD